MGTQTPTVSFVVPCYNLAHLLPECIHSILGQTYGDFEVLIMDDGSTDGTADVARGFGDRRVRHIRNDPNIGALPNYNKGIRLSLGKYIWLISADDYLRRPFALERYVDLMEKHPRVGYTFCPGVEVRNGKETGLLNYSMYGNRDRVMTGRGFLQKLLYGNLILAPAVMVRHEYYEKFGDFPIQPVWHGIPIDLIWGGDWYLWCLFALHGEVGYFAAPMVCYREHELSSTTVITREKLKNCFRAEIGVRWQIKEEAEKVGLPDVAKMCLQTVAIEYARHLTTKQYRSSSSTITLDQFEESLRKHTADERERNWIRGRVYAQMGARLHSRADLASAKVWYRKAARIDPWLMKVQANKFFLLFGRPGNYVRESLRKLH